MKVNLPGGFILFFIPILLLSHLVQGQTIQISGKVVDALSKEPVIGAVITLKKNKSMGTTSDVEGNFSFSFNWLADSLQVSFVGYTTQTLAYSKNTRQNFEILLKTDELQAVTVTGRKENPAWEIIRKTIKNKDKNDKRSLEAYQYESYNRVEAYVNHDDKGVGKLKVMRQMKEVAEKIPELRDEQDKVLIPVLVSESLSEVYALGKPEKIREDVKITNMVGLGIEDAKGVGQILTGGHLNEYNFYRNQVYILDKYFASPLADGWRLTYDYILLDSLMVEGDFCYELDVKPRNDQSLAFIGTIWITKKEYALKKADLRITDNANINFLKSLHVVQTNERTEAGPWLPIQVDFEVHLSEFAEILPDIYAKARTLNENIVINQAKDGTFYSEQVRAEAKEIKDYEFWRSYRQQEDNTVLEEVDVYQVIDSLKQLRSVKNYTGLLRTISIGYYEWGKISIGHLSRFYAWNDIEGHRPGFGFRTNSDLSRNFNFKGRVAYGTLDQKVKYDVFITQVVSRKHYTRIGVARSEDLTPLILLNPTEGLPELFEWSNRFFTMSTRRPFFRKESTFWVERRFAPFLTQKVSIQQREFTPIFNFAFYKNTEAQIPESNFSTTELTFQSTFKYNKRNSIRLLDDSEVDISHSDFPKITLTTILGLKGTLGGEFNYQKVFIDVSKKNSRLFGLGHVNYAINAGYIFGQIPYPLLQVHLGNNTPYLIERGFNQMNGFEFISDHFVSFHYAHYLESFLLSRLPLLKKANKFLDWRLVASFNMVYGGLRQENRRLFAEQNSSGEQTEPLGSLSASKPYMEVGYGIDNILKFFRVDIFHRLTYLDLPTARPWGIKFSAEIKL